MADFQETKKLSAETGYSFSLLSEVQKSESHTDTILYSDGRSVAVHSAIISNCSELMSNLLASTESKIIILPCFSTILFDFVSLVYTGHAANLSVHDTELLASLCTELGMTTSVMKESITADKDNVHRAKGLAHSDFLKLETEMYSVSSKERFHLRLPMSRIDHKSGQALYSAHVFEFEGFRGRIQQEYNCSPVGPYEGPYDQDPQLLLFAQLSKSKLNYDKYTNFSHPENIQCKIFQIKQKPEDIGDLDKIETLEVVEESTDIFVKPSNQMMTKEYFTLVERNPA